jgi:hypothetical protein
MSQPDRALNEPTQPALSNLFAEYLRQQVARQAAGLARADNTGEVVPFEAATAQPVDASLAWSAATAVAQYLQPASTTRTWKVPPEWAALVSAQEPAVALAFSFGNYPQLVRDLHALLHVSELTALLPTGAGSAASISLGKSGGGEASELAFPQALFTLGIMRLARHFDEAEALLKRLHASTPANWQAAWANEEAALAWHRGQVHEAATLWQKQPLSVPVLFNRGMAALFLGKAAEACPLLSKAVDQLSGEDGWHHLGRLYLTLAEMH